MSTFLQNYTITVVVAILTICALIAAVLLQILGDDANKAWDAFAGFSIFFAGVHVPTPTSSGG